MFGHHHSRGPRACHGPHDHGSGERHGRHARHGGFGEEGGRGRFGGGRSRVFDQGDLRLVLLALIAEKPSHGYELIKAVEEKLGGAYTPSPGVVYPTLTLLEEMGYASVQPVEGGRKLYAATPEGRAWLDTNRATVEAIFGRMAETRGRAGVSPQIVRAMENLRLALKLKLGGGELTEEQLRTITSAIDATAVEVERA